MNIAQLEAGLLYALLINYSIVLLWFSAFVYAHEALYRLHRRWFQLSVETFDAIHYSALALYKIGIMLFILSPLLGIWLMATP